MIYEVKWSGKFKKGYKLAKKRGLDISLLEEIIDNKVYEEKMPEEKFEYSRNIR